MTSLGMPALPPPTSDPPWRTAWDRALYTGRLVRPATRAEAFTPGAVREGTTTYGFGWWGYAEGTHAYHYALGFGGQFIVDVPDLDLVVVLTANPYAPDTAPVDHFRALLRDQILPAILPE